MILLVSVVLLWFVSAFILLLLLLFFIVEMDVFIFIYSTLLLKHCVNRVGMVQDFSKSLKGNVS